MELIREHEQEIEHHYSEIRRLIHTKGTAARCNTCGCHFEPEDNFYGYCSESCFREQND